MNLTLNEILPIAGLSIAVVAIMIIGKKLFKVELVLNEILQIAGISIAVAAIFVGINMFNQVASLDIKLNEMIGSSLGGNDRIFKKDILNYYKNNDIKIPAYINGLFLDLDKNPVKIGSLDNLVKYSGEKYGVEKDSLFSGGWIGVATKTIESDLINNKNTSDFSIITIKEEYITSKFLVDKSSALKNNLSENQYFVFLAALLNSRIFEQSLEIINNGDIDLRNIKITITPPFNTGSIVKIYSLLNAPIIIREINNYWEILIPSLIKNAKINVQVKLKINKLVKENIYKEFKKTTTIDLSKVCTSSFSIFAVLLFISLIYKKHFTASQYSGHSMHH